MSLLRAYRPLACTALVLLAVLGTMLPGVLAQQGQPPSPEARQALAQAAGKVREIVAHRGSSADRPENTLAAFERAIDAGATAIEADIRQSTDGQLFVLHDAELERTTNGKGIAEHLTLAELQTLDAGAWFGEPFRGERIPTLREICELSNGRADLFLDLKDGDEPYFTQVVRELRRHGDPRRTLLGVRSLSAARYFRQHLPESRMVGLLPNPSDLDLFLGEGIRIIRLWPHWINPPDGDRTAGDQLIARIRAAEAQILVSAGKGTLPETEAILRASPELVFTDDPATLVATLRQLQR
jgi:glycerophosphoryl diester phosphodiesterase